MTILTISQSSADPGCWRDTQKTAFKRFIRVATGQNITEKGLVLIAQPANFSEILNIAKNSFCFKPEDGRTAS